MEKDFRTKVLIELISEIERDGDTDRMHQHLNGEWFRRGDAYTLRYVEEEEKITTLIRWQEKGEEIVILRQGAASLRLVIAPGQSMQTVYATPYGHFLMNVITHHLHMDVTDLGGTFHIAYKSDFNDGEKSEHRMIITFSILS